MTILKLMIFILIEIYKGYIYKNNLINHVNIFIISDLIDKLIYLNNILFINNV